MNERNVLAGTTATVLSPFVDGWQNLFVWIIVAFALILGDLRFGICAARKRGEKIRGSRAVRRTINKMVDYICWVSIARVGRVFGGPLLAAIIMLVVCTIELSSIFDNYCEYKGLKKHFNVFKFLARLFKRPEIEECFEENESENN